MLRVAGYGLVREKAVSLRPMGGQQKDKIQKTGYRGGEMRGIIDEGRITFYRQTVCSLLCSVSFTVFCVLTTVSLVFADVEDIQIVKISPKEERAVVKMPDGKMKIIKTGDVLRVIGSELRVAGSGLKDIKKQDAGNELRVVEIAKGRIVFEEKTEKGGSRQSSMPL